MTMYAGDPQTQAREQEQIIGTVTGVVSKGGDKYQAAVAPDGSQYTKNLWTKDIAVVQYLNGMIGQRLAFLCNVSHWTNAQNQSVRSLWIDQVGSPGVGSPAMAGPPQQNYAQPTATMVHPEQHVGQQIRVQPTVAQMAPPMQMGVSQDVKEERIHRQTASKVAAILLSNLPQEERNMSTLLTLSERLVAYYFNGVSQAETVEDLMNRAMPQEMEGPPPDPGQYTGDDDIPF